MSAERDGARPVRLRKVLDDLPAYVAGQAVSPPEGLTPYKLSSNENPYPPLPEVQAVIDAAGGAVNRYPDMAVTELTARLATEFGVEADQVATGCGSVGVLQQILAAACEPGDEVVMAWRSFEAYPILTALTGATAVRVPLTSDERHDLPAMARAVTDATSVVLVCSPNNPTGPCVGTGEFEEFLAAVPPSVLVVLDEAYVEFVRDPQAPDGLALLARHPNLVVLRTFSKAYGLAGLRVGFALAHPLVAAGLRKAALPFGVNAIAQAAAMASLDARAALMERVEALAAERTRVIDALTADGWQLPASEGNFVWFRLGEHTGEFARRLEAEAVSARPYGDDGVRVTIGEPEANDRMVAVAARCHDLRP